MNPGQQTLLRSALRYAQDGVHVFPCVGKIPIRGTHGVLDATTDAKQITEWWTKHPEANIGIAAGASNLVIVDVDCKHGVNGWDSIDEMMATLGQLPGTRMASTPNGGAHVYFKAPDGVTIRPSCGKVAPAIDIRAGNSYVIAPPSVIDDKRYRWDVRGKCAELPESWVNALRPPEARLCGEGPPEPRPSDDRVHRFCLAALKSEVDELAKAPSGTRSDHLWRAAAALGGLAHLGVFDADEIRRALLWACSHWGEDRTPRKTSATLERGLAFGLENPREWGRSAAA